MIQKRLLLILLVLLAGLQSTLVSAYAPSAWIIPYETIADTDEITSDLALDEYLDLTLNFSLVFSAKHKPLPAGGSWKLSENSQNPNPIRAPPLLS